MNFAEAIRLAPYEEELPHRNAHRRFTGRGSFYVADVFADRIIITNSRGTRRAIIEKDWNEVQENLEALKAGGKVRQTMSTRNATYVLSLMAYYADGTTVGSMSL